MSSRQAESHSESEVSLGNRARLCPPPQKKINIERGGKKVRTDEVIYKIQVFLTLTTLSPFKAGPSYREDFT